MTMYMKMAFIGLLTSTIMQQTEAQAQETIKLYGKPTYMNASCATKESEPKPGSIHAAVNPDIQVFLPQKQNEHKGAILILPGGGYSHLAMKHEGKDIAVEFAKQGLVAVVLKYRMPLSECFANSMFVPLSDVQKALIIMRANAIKWNFDTSNVGIIGFSAGGHLASTALTHSDTILFPNEPTPLHLSWGILGYPVITMDGKMTHTGSRKNLIGEHPDAKWEQYFSNELHVNEKTPKTFLFAAQDDDVVPVENSLLFYDAMVRAKVKGELHIYESGGHGFGLHNPRSLENWFDAVCLWLRRNQNL